MYIKHTIQLKKKKKEKRAFLQLPCCWDAQRWADTLVYVVQISQLDTELGSVSPGPADIRTSANQ